MKALALIFSLALVQLLWGCALPSTHYTVTMNPNLGAVGMENVITALEEWSEKTDVTFDVRVSDQVETGNHSILFWAASQDYITQAAGRPASGLTRHPAVLDNATILVLPNVTVTTALHELGHALYLQHTEYGTMMYHCADQAGTDHLTQKDIDQYYQVKYSPRGALDAVEDLL